MPSEHFFDVLRLLSFCPLTAMTRRHALLGGLLLLVRGSAATEALCRQPEENVVSFDDSAVVYNNLGGVPGPCPDGSTDGDCSQGSASREVQN